VKFGKLVFSPRDKCFRLLGCRIESETRVYLKLREGHVPGFLQLPWVFAFPTFRLVLPAGFSARFLLPYDSLFAWPQDDELLAEAAAGKACGLPPLADLDEEKAS